MSLLFHLVGSGARRWEVISAARSIDSAGLRMERFRSLLLGDDAALCGSAKRAWQSFSKEAGRKNRELVRLF